MPPSAGERLDDFTTSWSLLQSAHDPDRHPEQQEAARRQLVERYQNVVRRYLAGALRHERDRDEAVDDCFGEFGLRVMRGAFRNVAPERGSFRHYLKACLCRLVTDYRGRRPPPGERPLGSIEPPAPEPTGEEEFTQLWREELLNRAVEQLREDGALYTVARLKMGQPGMTSQELADELARLLGKPVTDSRARQLLVEARRRLAEHLAEEVRRSLDDPTTERLMQELADLGLLEVCRPALEKKGPGP